MHDSVSALAVGRAAEVIHEHLLHVDGGIHMLVHDSRPILPGGLPEPGRPVSPGSSEIRWRTLGPLSDRKKQHST